MEKRTNSPPIEPPSPRYLDRIAVARMLGVNVRTLDSWVANGKFIRPIRLGSLCRWRESAILEHLKEREREANGLAEEREGRTRAET